MLKRRDVLIGASALAVATPLQATATTTPPLDIVTKAIPKTGEHIPVIGLGTSEPFNLGSTSGIFYLYDEFIDALLGRESTSNRLAQRRKVLEIFFAQGGTLIDTSPKYGSAESVIGELMSRIDNAHAHLFAATKVWAEGKDVGITQMNASMQKLGVDRMDLMQVHNLTDWQTHLPTLRAWKAEGKIRYIGITTSRGRRHAALSEIMKNEDVDFVQFSYSIDERSAEKTLLSIAADKGIATVINRPFRRGDIFQTVKDKPLPDWVSEIGVETWGQYFLKFVVSHPAVTCAIPATGKPHHMLDNMGANVGGLPDAAMRAEMVTYFESLSSR